MPISDAEVYKLNSLIRYSTRLRCKDESVASHSFFVLWFTKKICNDYKLNDDIRLMAYDAAIIHDVPEIYTNDITYDVKCKIPAINDIIKPIEEEVVKTHCSTSHAVLFEPDTFSQKVAHHVVKLADIMSVYQYCANEVSMGNTNFEEMLGDTRRRMGVQRYKMEFLIREGRESE